MFLFSSFLFSFLFKNCVKRLPSDRVQLSTGGNAALMAQHLVSDSGSVRAVRLVGAVGPVLRGMLPAAIDVPAISLVERDEYHLILEYVQAFFRGTIRLF
jgi:hypothetical protein